MKKLASAHIFQTAPQLRLKEHDQCEQADGECAAQKPVNHMKIQDPRQEIGDNQNSEPLNQLLRPGFLDEFQYLVKHKGCNCNVQSIIPSDAVYCVCEKCLQLMHKKSPSTQPI